jgi:hypothetical protein
MEYDTLKELEEEVKDYEKQVAGNLQELKDAQEWLWKSKVYLADAIIRLNDYKKQHEPTS